MGQQETFENMWLSGPPAVNSPHVNAAMGYSITPRPANFEKQKFVFWHLKIRILYQKIVFFKTNISERILNIYFLVHVFFIR